MRFNLISRRAFAGFVLLGFLCCSPAKAAEQATVPDLTFRVTSGSIIISPPKAHHFNEKAPAEVHEGDKILGFKLKPSELKASLPKGPQEHLIDILVYICDDAKTFCKKKTQSFLTPPRPSSSQDGAAAVSAAGKSAKSREPKSYVDRETGFIVNDPKKAFALAAQRKLPLLIDFYSIWCSPCNHLDAIVFKSKEFRAKNATRFILLKIDTDQDFAGEYKKKYKIQGLPTVVFATNEGEEIFRVVGFHPLDEMITKADAAYTHRDEGYDSLVERAGEEDLEAKYQAALIALDRDEPAQALKWLLPTEKLLTETHDRRLRDLYRAQLGVAQATGDHSGAKKVIENWLKEFPNTPDGIENYQTLAELQEQLGDKNATLESWKHAVALVDQLLLNPDQSLKGSYYTKVDLTETQADLYEKLGDQSRAKVAYLSCAEAYAAEARAEGAGFARGPSLERAYCLGKAGKVTESEAIYREGIKRFPEESTFYQGLARMMLDSAKQPKKAVEASEMALTFAYGNQRLKAVLTKAKALEEQLSFKAAVEAIQSELASPAPPNASPGTLKLREKLQTKKIELEKKASKATTPHPSV